MARVATRGAKQTPDPALAEKYLEVARLRSMGLTFPQIADRVGYSSPSSAHDAYRRALQLWGQETVAEARGLVNARFDTSLRSVYGQLAVAERGRPVLDVDGATVYDGEGAPRMFVDPYVVLACHREIVRIESARARLLGLNAPQQIEVLPPPRVSSVGDMLREQLDKESRRQAAIPAEVLSGDLGNEEPEG
jgi:hypothetical protein